MHFVNYFCPIPTKVEAGKGRFRVEGSPDDYAPKVLKQVAVRLNIRAGKVSALKIFDPDSPEPVSVSYKQDGSIVEFVLPEIGIYKIAALEIDP